MDTGSKFHCACTASRIKTKESYQNNKSARIKLYSPRWIDTTRRRATRPDLLVHVAASGYVESAPDAHAGAIEGARPGFGHVTVAVDLLVIDRVLIVVVGLQGEFRTADRAFEAARVEERKVLQGTHPVDLVDSLGAPQTRALVEVGPIHDDTSLSRRSNLAWPGILLRIVRHVASRRPDHRSLQSRSVQCFALDACDLGN